MSKRYVTMRYPTFLGSLHHGAAFGPRRRGAFSFPVSGDIPPIMEAERSGRSTDGVSTKPALPIPETDAVSLLPLSWPENHGV